MTTVLFKALIFAGVCTALSAQHAAAAAPIKGKPAPPPSGSRPCETGDPRGRTDCFGVSGSTRKYLIKPDGTYYYAGTIGALVADSNNKRYMLSNNHVFAQENGNGGQVTVGDAVIQPGNLEWYYFPAMTTASIDVGTLYLWKEVVYGPQNPAGDNLVDAAIAELTPQNALDPQGRILSIGPINPTPTSPDAILGQPVHKAGRTTGHTWGMVTAVHVDNVAVSYDGGTAYFDDQIYVANQGSCGSFSAGGDSGSLIVSGPNVDTKKSAPVALLFAGGSQGTFGNPIGAVLNSFPTSPLHFVACDTSTGGDCSAYATSVSSCIGGGSSKPKGQSRSADHMSSVAMANLKAIKARNRNNLSAIQGVTGIGIAQGDNGQGEFAIFVESLTGAKGIPEQIEGIDVRVIETGVVKAY